MIQGKPIGGRRCAQYGHDAGWRDENLLVAVAIAHAESSLYPEADNTDQNGDPTNPDGSIDYGLWQINSIHIGQLIGGKRVTASNLLDPTYNAEVAYALWKQNRSFLPWAAYQTNRYTVFLGVSTVNVCNFWRERYGIWLIKEA